MAFQIKSFAAIAASMVHLMRSVTDRLTDFRVGSVSRTLVEATAAEIDELYINVLVGLREAIPVSVFNTFGFAALPAQSASVVLRFSTPGGALAATAVIIPAGTAVRAPGGAVQYSTSQAAVIGIGQSYVQVLAIASVPGVVGNADANTLTQMVSAVSGVGTVVNAAPVINGRDVETDDERRVRFQGYIASLSRGTKASLEYGARTVKLLDVSGVVTEYVATATVQEPWTTDPTQPLSLVRCYIHNGASATSAALVAQTQRVLDGYFDGDTPVPGWKAAGVRCVVLAATDMPVNVTGTVYVSAGFDPTAVAAASVRAVAAYLQTRSVGQSVLAAEIVAILQRDVAGIYNVLLNTPLADVAVPSTQKAVPGAITLFTA